MLIKAKTAFSLISLGDNQLDDEFIQALINYTSKNKMMKYISLKNNNITSAGASLLFDVLRESDSQISCLDLSENKLDDNCMDSLGKYIQSNSSIKHVNISSRYEFKDNPNTPSLKPDPRAPIYDTQSYFNIILRSMSDDYELEYCTTPWSEIINGYKVDTTANIDSIFVGSNQITDKGIDTICKYLIGNESLATLDVHGNIKITGESFDNIREIATKSRIEKMFIFNTSINKDDLLQLWKYFELPAQERDIEIFSNSKSAAKIS